MDAAFEREGDLPFIDHLSGAEHNVRKGRLNKFPARDGTNRFRQTGRQPELDVLHQNLLQRLVFHSFISTNIEIEQDTN